MLKVNNVTKKYEKLTANSCVSLEVNDGEIAVLLGHNGAGKSTLIKCICGLLRFEGEITLNGFNNKSLEAKRLIGYIPEMPQVYDLLTVEEHLEFIRRSYKLEDDGTGHSLLKLFELYDKRDKLGKELSKGMQQKLSICCALVHKPEIIIFDEPMVGLDPYAIKQLKSLFIKLKNEGKSILISTHMLDSVEDFWDTAYIMADAKVVACKKNGESGSLEELFFSTLGSEK